MLILNKIPHKDKENRRMNNTWILEKNFLR